MINYKIMAVESRKEMAESLRDKIGLTDEDIIYDDRPNGGNPFYTCKKAWLSPAIENETHRLVMNEDIEVCDNFQSVIEQIVPAHPDAVFTLFSTAINDAYYDKFGNSLESPYIEHNNGMFGCAILMPSKYIEECFAWIDSTYLDQENIVDTQAILSFVKYKKLPLLTTVPMIVQHIGDDSLFDPSLPIRRTTRFKENPNVDWTQTKINKLPEIEWFKPIDKNDPKRPLNQSEVVNIIIKKQINEIDIDDATSLRMTYYYPTYAQAIEENKGKTVKLGFKFTYNGDLYKTIQPELTLAEHFVPGIGTESLFERIDEVHTGTIEDPIPYKGNMQIYEGKYYIENDILYVGIRDSGIALSQSLADLKDNFVKVVE